MAFGARRVCPVLTRAHSGAVDTKVASVAVRAVRASPVWVALRACSGAADARRICPVLARARRAACGAEVAAVAVGAVCPWAAPPRVTLCAVAVAVNPGRVGTVLARARCAAVRPKVSTVAVGTAGRRGPVACARRAPRVLAVGWRRGWRCWCWRRRADTLATHQRPARRCGGDQAAPRPEWPRACAVVPWHANADVGRRRCAGAGRLGRDAYVYRAPTTDVYVYPRARPRVRWPRRQ